LVGAGLHALARRAWIGLPAALFLAFFFGREAWPEARIQAKEQAPPMAAIAALERYVHPGRETIVADEDFHAFLRTERWEGRLVAWGYLDSELVAGVKQFNKRLVRLQDFTAEGGPPDGTWRIFFRGGRAAQALGNDRLLSVGLRDPAPPLFFSGFGVKESSPGAPSFRWAGPSAHLLVPGLEGPPVALLSGERPPEGGEMTLRVTDHRSGKEILSRRIVPGPFEVALVSPPVFGPLPSPVELVLSCDHPIPLPTKVGGVRPTQGCFIVREATSSVAPESLWEAQGGRRLVDVGSPRDLRADPEGFYGREPLPSLSVDMRWTTAAASVVWVPIRGFSPKRLALRARAPSKEPVDVTVAVGGLPAGHLAVPAGDFTEVSLALSPRAAEKLSGADAVRISFTSATWNPKKSGFSNDDRELGIGVDRIALE
ncbi:MAG TPA: hypothetical protein VGR00_04600, partial [Thermoanaerobaculia bacterium]|nr:hypothetical protein [Thermoanaerobaculia bacterium]